jgi:hypothetical protein
VAEALSKTPDPIYEQRSWREDYEADLQAMRVEIKKREKAHKAYLEGFLVQNGCLLSLQEDKYGEGLEMFINRLALAPQQGQKQQQDREDNSEGDSKDDSEDDSKDDSKDNSKDNSEDDGEDDSKGNGEDGSKDDSRANSEDNSELDNGALEDSKLDPEYKDY